MYLLLRQAAVVVLVVQVQLGVQRCPWRCPCPWVDLEEVVADTRKVNVYYQCMVTSRR